MSQLTQYGEDRLVVGNGITLFEENYGKFHISDFWMFGKSGHLQNWYDVAGIDTTYPCFRRNVSVRSPEADFVQVWLERQGIVAENIKKLLAQYFIVIDGGTVELIYKTQALDTASQILIKYWDEYRDSKTVRHSEWLKLYHEYQ